MTTRLIDKIYVERKNNSEKEITDDFLEAWKRFLNNEKMPNTFASNIIISAYDDVRELIYERWVTMTNGLVYDKRIESCWLGLTLVNDTESVETDDTNILWAILKVQWELFSNSSLESNNKAITTRYLENFLNTTFEETNIKADIPTEDEVFTSFKNLDDVPFDKDIDQVLYRENSYNVQRFIVKKSQEEDDWDYKTDSFFPIYRLNKNKDISFSKEEIFFLWITNKFTPSKLCKNDSYKILVNFNYQVEDFFQIKEVTGKLPSLSGQLLYSNLLLEDKKRADIQEYHEKMLTDIEQGHWSLWQDEADFENPMPFTLNEKLVARDPKSSIVNGVVGIDFGTKSTVVAYQKDSTKIYPMRVGTGNLTKTISAQHYENPTIMEFNDLEEFVSDYKSREGRPYTSWEDLSISHTAFSSLMNSKSSDFNAYISELKQWAGNKDKKLTMVDKKGYVLDLPPFMEMDENHINPIEIYAYYLGLYINNQHNGIYMNYILSFPVTYEIEIRDRIVESFKKGITKSLPQELHNQAGEVEKLSIKKGASEPAAYAIVALQEYSFEPEDDEKVFYGVFDFGGGTTDFDFGIFRESNGRKERRYDYAIEHFGAGGDRYLGGENLLELLAFEIFKNNRDELLAQSIQFILPPECDAFLGSEMLLSQSREAKMNTKTLMEKLRPFWEQHEDALEKFDNGVLEVNLTKIDGQNLANFELTIDKDKMFKVLENRIEKGVKNFFESLRLAFNHKESNLNSINEINIFLAGNSSKSALVSKIFKTEIEKITEELKGNIESEKEYFKIFQPLGNENGNLEKPTGKTGVAFGLIESREGGDILVLDHNVKENINFKYYLGESRKKKFKVVVDREQEYNEWVEFIDATQETFELYYSSQSLVSTNKMPIDDNSIKKRIFKIDKIDDEALVYVRTTTPTEFEYVVAYEDKIALSEYLQDVVRVSL